MTTDQVATLIAQVSRLEQRFDDQDRKLDRIEKRVCETNGRVRKGEMTDERIKGMIVGLGVVAPFLVVLVGVLADHLLR